MRCQYCEGEHPKAADVRACWERSRRRDEFDQIRAHGLAGAGLSDAPADKEQRAIELRATQTPTELGLGARLKELPWRFEPQAYKHGYILDFYATELSLGIEVDGGSHAGRETADRLRDQVLASQRIQVLRFTADEVREGIDAVLITIQEVARQRVGKYDRQDLHDAAWYVWRYGLPEPEPEPGPAPKLPPLTEKKYEWRCVDCERNFLAPAKPPPECRGNRRHKVRAVCMTCSKASGTTPPRCDTCRDASEVARESAGPGAHAPGDQLPQARKARRWKGR